MTSSVAGAPDPPKGAPDYFTGRRREISPLVKRLFRSGPGLYRGPMAAVLGRYHMLVLTTTGRKSGLPRATALTFMPWEGGYVVAAGMGKRSDWVRNVLAQPEVQVQVGRRRFPARATLVADPARRRELVAHMLPYWDRFGPPRLLRWLLRRVFGFDYDAELRQALAHAAHMPVVTLMPVTMTSKGKTA
jgi:deazaflavin-dependent oxidoreductase (nitroreductase family)